MWYSVFEPRYALAAADLAERAGNAALGRSERARFVQAWKGGQPAARTLADLIISSLKQ